MGQEVKVVLHYTENESSLHLRSVYEVLASQHKHYILNKK